MNVTYVRGALLAAVACILVGASFTANSVLGDYPYAGGQALRYGLAALLLLPLLHREGEPRPAATLRRLSGGQWRRLALLAAVGMVGFNLAVLAAERSAEPAVPGVFVGCAPILVAVLVPLLDGRRPTRAVLYAAALVAAGAFTVQGWGRTDLTGILCSVGALTGEVGFAVLAVPVLRPLGPKLLSATVCAIAAAESAALGLVLDGGGFLRVPTGAEAAALIWQAAVVTVVGFVCWYMGMQRIGAERATLFSGLIPVSAALTAPLVGTGSYGVAQAAGSCLVGLGVAIGSGMLARRGAAGSGCRLQRLVSRITLATRAGSSFIGTWPQPGRRTSRAPGMLCFALIPWRRRRSRSRPPQAMVTGRPGTSSVNSASRPTARVWWKPVASRSARVSETAA